MAIIYSYKSLIERVRRHIADGWPAVEFSISANEVLLYINAATATTLVASMMGINKITREMATPEAYITTTNVGTLVQNSATGEWSTTLPQTPLSLSIGYSISNAYFSDPALGQSDPIWLIKSKRVAYRGYMPRPTGTSATIRGNTINVKASDGGSLAGLQLYVDMVTTRTSNVNDIMAIPDDAIDMIFDKVVQKCMQRLGIPSEVVKDDIGAKVTNINKA